MAISLASIKSGVSNDPPIITIFGEGGVGKTTFCANSPNPIFVFTEKSLGKLDVARFEYDNPDGSKRYIAESFEEVMTSLSVLLGEHSYNTVVLDSLDWFEGLVEQYLLLQRPTTDKGRAVKNIKDYGFNTGASFVLDYWNEYFALIRELQTKKNMMVIQTSHVATVKMTPPDSDGYTAYSLKLEGKAREKIIEGSDVVLFASTKIGITTENMGFNQTRNRAIGGSDKYIYTEDRAAHEGKNKYSLPYEISVKEKDWSDVWGILTSHIPWFQQFGAPATAAAPSAPVVPMPPPPPPPVLATPVEKPVVPAFLNKPKTA